MGLIDQMKYAKMLYLADVLEDIQNDMRKDWHCRNFADSINGIVKDVRETIAATTPPNEMECEKNPAYIDVTDPVVIKKYYPWMSNEEIQERLESEFKAKELEAIRDLPYEEWMQRMLAMPGRPNNMPTSNLAPVDLPRQLELKFSE